MNYIKEAEEVLKNQRKLKDSIISLNARKNNIVYKSKPKDIGAIDYSKPGIQKTSYLDDTLNQIFEIMEIDECIKETEAEIKIIDDILKDIKKEDEEMEKFLVLKYLTDYKSSMAEIAEKMGYSLGSNKTIYNIKSKALREFVIRYFGIRGLKAT